MHKHVSAKVRFFIEIIAVKCKRASRACPPLHVSLPNLLGGIVLMIMLAGCASQARLVKETATGGTITYPVLHEQDVLSSTGRYDALQLLEKKCSNGYRIIREGETARINQAIDKAWNGQIPPEKIWTIQFECK